MMKPLALPALLRTSFMTPARLVLLLAAAGLWLAWRNAGLHLPAQGWWQAMLSPDPSHPLQLAYHHGILPRNAMALLAGAALGLSGSILQQVLRNPLAEPATIGISAGAHLAMAAAMLWAPAWMVSGREWVALAGSGLTAALVCGLAWRQALAPATLVLAGLVVSLYMASMSSMLVLLSHDYLSQLFLWNSGSLQQSGWAQTQWLAPRVLAGVLLAALLARPLGLLALGDAGARSLGLPVGAARLAAVALAVALSACVSAAVGVISFIGLAAPWLARLAGARGLGAQLFWPPLIGAALLFVTDQLAQQRVFFDRDIPTGVATAFLGTPLLLWMLHRMRPTAGAAAVHAPGSRPRRRSRASLAWAGLALAALAVLSALYGASPDGWGWAAPGDWHWLMALRAPRVLAAVSAGAMLAMIGAILQRATGNPMASPEVLGISAGAVLGVIVLFLVSPAFGRFELTVAAAAGAAVTAAFIVAMTARAGFPPERMLLVGMGISMLLAAATSLFLASGDPRAPALLAWVAGSTAHVTMTDAYWTTFGALAVLAFGLTWHRWLEILPLGDLVASELGMNLRRVRLTLVALTAATAMATLVAGPLSFVGLLAPHLARMLGAGSARAHLIVSALLGGFIMACADWLGRNLIYPWPLPAGLVATLIGGPYLLWLLRRS